MKNIKPRFLIVFIFLVFCQQVQSQFYTEFGYKTGFWLNTSGINSLIKDFNNSRPWLDKEMRKMYGGHGGRLVIGYGGGYESPFSTFFNLEWFRSAHSANGINPLTNQREYYELVSHVGGFGVGCALGINEGQILIGSSFNFWRDYVARIKISNTESMKLSTYTSSDIEYPANPSVNIFARFAAFDGPFRIALTPQLDIPIFGKNEFANLSYYLHQENSNPSAYLRTFTLTLMASMIISPGN